MSSSFVADTTDDSSNAGNTVIIIVNDDTGNISVDQEMLQILASQENTTLSVVRVNDTSGENSTDVNMTVEEIYNPSHGNTSVTTEEKVEDDVPEKENENFKLEARAPDQGIETADPLLNLDQEEIEKIAHALQEEQAGSLFGNILPQEAGLDDLLDPELTGDPDVTDPVATISLDHCYSAASSSTSTPIPNRLLDEADTSLSSGAENPISVKHTSTGGNRNSLSPKRRSQRQIDRQEMEQLKKIRAENEELLKKEKENMNQALQSNLPKKEEVDTVPESSVLLQPDTSTSSEPTSTQPMSRLSVIRQELQQKILAVDPIKPKVVASSQNLNKSMAGKHTANQTHKAQSGKSIQNVESPQPSLSKEVSHGDRTPLEVDVNKTPKNTVCQSPAEQESLTTPSSRPRRENRQPPKHLREAFNQLEFEGVERTLKRTSRNANSSAAENSSQESEDDTTANDKTNDSEEAEEDDEFGEDSDEDPEKLWCICRKPHNNRFMICCDKCEDWFHGKCVGVTRAMGRELERKGLEWICPKCVRQEYANRTPHASLEELIIPAEATVGSPRSQDNSMHSPVGTPVSSSSQDLVEKTKGKTTPQRMGANRTRTESASSATEESSIARRCVAAGCKNDARTNSVYCSDACIVTHARDSLIAMSKEKTKQVQQQSDACSTSSAVTSTAAVISTGATKWKESLEFGALMSQPTPPLSAKSKAVSNSRKSSEAIVKPANLADETPVPVMERKSGKILTGSSAPKVGNLENWLKDNPTYEVIKPATLPRANKPRPLNLISPSVSSSVALSAKSVSPVTPTSALGHASSPASSLAASKGRLVSNQASAKKGSEASTPAASKPKVVRKRSLESGKDEETPKKAQPDTETTRSSAKSSLKDALWNRCKEAADVQADEKTVEQVADEIEEALFYLFNKDVGTKYKSRYRSLIFNIKDPKNLGLFRKIIERQITPGQLVKMTAEELASKELAEWREREAKHQLDIIQKTEMELMTMSNKYLVKTHKGEEIIEEVGKELEERDSSTSAEAAPPSILEALQDTTSKHKSHMFDLNCRICTKTIKEDELELEKSKEKESSTEKNKEQSGSSSHRKREEKSTRRSSHHSSTTEKDSKKHSSDRDRSRKDHDSKEHRHRDHDRKRKASKDRSRRSSSRSRRDSKERRHHSKDRHHHSSSSKHRSDREKERKKEGEDKRKEAKKETVKEDARREDVAPSTTSETTPAPQDVPMDQDNKLPDSIKETLSDSEALAVPISDDSQSMIQPPSAKFIKEEEPLVKQEPTSTVTVKTPEQSSPVIEPGLSVVWKGTINSTETGKVNVQALDLCGSTDFSDVDLPASLDIVGRIRPEMVWDYVNQTRKAGSREVVVFKFIPSTDGDRKNYSAFLSHMYKANRFAVVGPVSKLIKDFYIVPLPKDSPIPLALNALAQQKSLDENRTSSLLLGVVVRARKKRTADHSSGAVPAKVPKISKGSARGTPSSTGSNSGSPSLSYIPSTRSATKKVTSEVDPYKSSRKEMASSTVKGSADDAPYSPGQLLNDDEPPVVDENILQQKALLDELNRKIEEEKKQLASMSAEIAPDVMIPGLGGPVVIPGLGDPAVPPSTSNVWAKSDSNEPIVTPSTDPPFEHSTKPASESLNLNISNLQEIISTIQKKEMEMKMINTKGTDAPSTGMRPLPNELFSPHDVDMRIPPIINPPVITQHIAPVEVAMTAPPEKKKPSLLNQLTDEELLAKAMEMEMEQAGIAPSPPVQNPVGQPFFSPPRGPGHFGPMPPMGGPHMAGPPRPPMGPGVCPPRPFHSPPYMPPRGPPFRSPPMQGGFRGRNKKKR